MMKRTQKNSRFCRPATSSAIWLIAFSVFAFSHFAIAQENPFGTPATPAPTTPGGPATPTVNPLAERDPVLQTIEDSNPTTPVDLARAVKAMMDYGRPADAKKYFDKLLAAAPDEKALADIHRALGSAFIFRLMRYEPLAPDGITLARAATDAAYKAARDEARLQTLVRDLSNPSLGIQRSAIVGLTEAGVEAVAPLVEALADSARSASHQDVANGLVVLGDVAIEPLIGALESPNEALVAQVIAVLGRLHARNAVKYLVGPLASDKSSDALRLAASTALERIVGEVPTKYDAREFLRRQANSYFDGQLPSSPELDGAVEMWRWDESQKRSVLGRYAPEAASLMVAARLARDLLDLDPANREVVRLYVASTLEAAKLAGGLDRPLDAEFLRTVTSQINTAALEDVLDFGMRNQHAAAAIGAAEALGFAGDESIVASDDGQMRALAQALRHPNRRLRFAAASAILKIDPKQPFPGSSHLAETLGLFIDTTGDRRILVGDPRTERVRTLVGILAEAGVVSDTASNGRQFFHMAAKNPDYDFVLLSDAVDFPHFKEVIQLIRTDPRTADLPIGLIVSGGELDEMKRFAARYTMVDAFPWPHDHAGLSLAIEGLISLSGQRMMSSQEKVQQAGAALDAMIRIVENPATYGFYEVLKYESAVMTALDHPELTSKAIKLLGLMATAGSQRALVRIASEDARPLADRQQAAAAFQAAVDRRGTMLSTTEITHQYERYNKSETLDQGTQTVLASILDTIEAPRKEEERQRELRRKASRSSQP